MDGRGLYVYGRVGAVGSEMKGETVRGTWERRGWDPGSVSTIANNNLHVSLTMIVVHDELQQAEKRRDEKMWPI